MPQGILLTSIVMGLDINAVQFLIAARQAGVSLGDVLTLGRQGLNVYPAKMIQLLERNGLDAEAYRSPENPEVLSFAESVFKTLGAASVSSMDASDYEGATYHHDLNQPIPSSLSERFDLVYDGGTLEHVFHFPQALKNCMEMVRLNGHCLLHTVANNYCGHGFYQFSPELFFRVFSEENGFAMQRMVIHPIGPYGRWRDVSDPADIKARVELINWYPVQLLILARRVRICPVLAQPPQQSDYSQLWDDEREDSKYATSSTPAFAPRHRRLSEKLPGLARLLNAFAMARDLYRSHSIRNRNSFKPVRRP